MFTDEQKKILGRHAAEFTEQQADHANEREALLERHTAEREAAGIASNAGSANAAHVVPSGGRRTPPAPSPAVAR